jgi:hypothetical protein
VGIYEVIVAKNQAFVKVFPGSVMVQSEVGQAFLPDNSREMSGWKA